MALSMHFYSGDPKIIGRALSMLDLDADTWPDGAMSHCRFSLHLAPKDMEILTQEISDTFNCNTCSFWDSLVKKVGGDDAGGETWVMASDWVALMAAIDDAWVDNFAEGWMMGIAQERRDPQIRVSSTIVAALQELVVLCRDAQANSRPVLLCWHR